MVKEEFCHGSICTSEVAHLSFEGKTFTRDKKIVYEMRVVKNNGSIYVVKRSHHDLEQLRKAVKKFARERSLKSAMSAQEKMKKLLAKSGAPSQLEQLEKLLNGLLVEESVRKSGAIREFVMPEDWLCPECPVDDEDSKNHEGDKLKFNKSVVSGPFHYPKFKVVRCDGLPVELKQPSPSVDDVVEVFKKDPSGWWCVLYKKELICFPSSYLRPESSQSDSENDPPTPALEEQFVARKSFAATREDEVSFSEGDSVKVVRMSYDGWWSVEIDSKSGLAPAVFLEPAKGLDRRSYANRGFSGGIECESAL